MKTGQNDQNYPLYNYRMQVPQQLNGYDCGIFLIEFAARFLLHPQSLVNNKKSSVIMDSSSDYEEEVENAELDSTLLADRIAFKRASGKNYNQLSISDN
jgi:Ulp1 family protease